MWIVWLVVALVGVPFFVLALCPFIRSAQISRMEEDDDTSA